MSKERKWKLIVLYEKETSPDKESDPKIF